MIMIALGLSQWLSGKESAYNAENSCLIPSSRRSPGEGNGNPPQYSLPGKFHGQRSLEDYSPWGRKRGRHDLATKQQHHHKLLTLLQSLKCLR